MVNKALVEKVIKISRMSTDKGGRIPVANERGSNRVKDYIKNKDKPNKVVEFNPKLESKDVIMDMRRIIEASKPQKKTTEQIGKMSKDARDAYIKGHKDAAALKNAEKTLARDDTPKEDKPEPQPMSVGDTLHTHHKDKGNKFHLGQMRGAFKDHNVNPVLGAHIQSMLVDPHKAHAFAENPKDFIHNIKHGMNQSPKANPVAMSLAGKNKNPQGK